MPIDNYEFLISMLNYFDFPDNVVAFCTTRHGGCSVGNYGSFNINPYCGDSAEAVAANKKELCGLLGVDEERLVLPHQTHQTQVRQIAEDFFSLSDATRTMLLEGVDALMTNVKGICIGVSTADCIPIIIYDAEHEASCVVHAGWRGTVARIVEKALQAMALAYGTSADALKVCIGPGISLDKFEVGDEVYRQFAEAAFPMQSVASMIGEKWHIDLWECNRLQLLGLGVLPENIFVSGICTYTQHTDYFSARRLGIESGRIFTGILMR